MDTKFMPSKPRLLDYVAVSEPWCSYELADGTICKVRIMVTKIIETGEFDNNGYPLYKLQFSQVIDMTWPDAIEQEAAKRRKE